MNKKNIIKIIVIIAVICIPIMYSFFYLKSYWDPYGKLNNMKIAIVNLDEGENDENLGQKFIDGLIEKDVINVCQVEEEKAQDGLVNEEYFAVITIPKTFSKYLNSASSNDKQIATITYSPNQKYNYLASQIISRVVLTAETELQSQVSEKVVETLSDNLKSVPESLGEISDGADKLLDGAGELSSGLNKINNGVGTLQNSYNDFDAGVNSAYTGSQSLTNGITQVNSGVGTLSNGSTTLDSAITQINTGANTLSTSAEAGISKLTNGINQVATGATQLSQGTSTLANGTNELAQQTPSLAAGANQLSTGASSLNAGVTQYVDSVNTSVSSIVGALTAAVTADPTLAANPYIAGILAMDTSTLSAGGEGLKAGAAQVNAGATQVNAGVTAVNDAVVNKLNPGAATVNAGAQSLNAGTTQLASQETTASLNQLIAGMGTLKNALGQVKTGTDNLKSGVATLSSGTNQLQSGSQTLTNGLGTLSSASGQVKDALVTLKDGSQSAYDGSIKLKDGIQELKDGVSDGINEANEELVKLDGLSDFVKDSVKIEEVDYGEVAAYGTAFTPLFISVGLWVGSLMAYVVLYYDQEKRFKVLGKFADNKLIQSILYLGIAVIQGLVTGFLLNMGLDLTITNYGLYYGSCVLIAITFMSIVQFLILNFGEVGKFLGLLILVLQLASSGGTFPVALIDEGFQKLTPYLPMTYTIKLTKEAVIQQQEGFASKNIKILIMYAISCLIITSIVQVCKKIYSKRREPKTETKSE